MTRSGTGSLLSSQCPEFNLKLVNFRSRSELVALSLWICPLSRCCDRTRGRAPVKGAPTSRCHMWPCHVLASAAWAAVMSA